MTVHPRPQEARRHVRVHPVRLLQHLVPVVLVERRQVPWPRGPHAGERSPIFVGVFYCVPSV